MADLYVCSHGQTNPCDQCAVASEAVAPVGNSRTKITQEAWEYAIEAARKFSPSVPSVIERLMRLELELKKVCPSCCADRIGKNGIIAGDFCPQCSLHSVSGTEDDHNGGLNDGHPTQSRD